MAPTVTQKRKKKRLQRTLALIRPDALRTRRGKVSRTYHGLNYHGVKLVSAFNLFLLSISQVKDILKIHFCIQRN